MIAVTLVLWQAFLTQGRAQIRHTLDAAAVGIGDQVVERVEGHTRALARMAARWVETGQPPRAIWEADAARNVQDEPDYQAIEWIDPALHIRWVVPLRGNEAALHFNLLFEARRRAALETSRDQRRMMLSRPIDLVQGGKGFLVYAPIVRHNHFEGFIAGVFRIPRLLASLSPALTQNYSLTVSEGGTEIYRQGAVSRSWEATWGRNTAVNLRDVTWQIRIAPLPDALAALRSPFPFMILAMGLVTTLLVGGLVYYIQSAHAAQRHWQEEVARRIESEARLAEAQHIVCLGHYEYTPRTGTMVWSEELYRLFDRDPALGPPRYKELLGYYHPEDRRRVIAARHQGFVAGQPYEFDLRLRQRDGSYRWCHAVGRPVRDAEGTLRRMVGTLLDITDRRRLEEQIEEQMMHINQANVELELQQMELAEANTQLEALAATDGLTGLQNHRTFKTKAEQEYERSRRYGTSLSIILLDVDHFKHFNDTFGHPAGDQVLKQVATVLQQTARTTDIVARYGGEEFVLVLPGTDRQDATACAERIRAAVATQPWEQRAITVSIGVATLLPATESIAALVKEADTALYQSKSGGRNQVTCYSAEDRPVAA
jgi:diguanylate cyclase (GGDEF)-like protein